MNHKDISKNFAKNFNISPKYQGKEDKEKTTARKKRENGRKGKNNKKYIEKGRKKLKHTW